MLPARASERSRRRIDDLNVYPVPDGDTGTNLLLTARGVASALDGERKRHSGRARGRGHPCRAAERTRELGRDPVADSSAAQPRLWPARGDRRPRDRAGLPRRERCGVRGAARAGRGHDPDRRRGSSPVAAEGQPDAEPPELFAALVVRGEEAVARTTEQLDVLRQAGVVDAGGAGLLELVRGMAAALNGEELPDAPAGRTSCRPRRSTRSSRASASARSSSSKATTSTSERSSAGSTASATR